MRAFIKFVGRPYSKQHGHRLGMRNGFSCFYSTKTYSKFKKDLGWEAVAQLRRQGWAMVDSDPVILSVEVRASRNLGDISNLVGGIEDALNGIAWTDDCQVVIGPSLGKMVPGIDRPVLLISLRTIGWFAFLNSEDIGEVRNWCSDGLKRMRKIGGRKPCRTGKRP
jgi:Holliday junction resolvase RusA-like endonuclease